VGPAPAAPRPVPREQGGGGLPTPPGHVVSVVPPARDRPTPAGEVAVEVAGARLDFARAMQSRVRASVAEGRGWDAFAACIRRGILRRRTHLEASFGP
jgi:hypothetical protein